MFCTKCGYNAGDAKFCPKCGNPISAGQSQTAQVEPEMPSQQESQMQYTSESVQQESQMQHTSGPVQQESQMQYTSETAQPQMQYTSQPFGSQSDIQVNKPKKKKKWPVVTAIVAAVVVIFGIAGYFAYPYISDMFSPKKQAVTALKNAGKDFESTVSGAVSKLSTTNASSKNRVKGSFKINSAKVDGSDYMSYMKVDTINYDIQMDSSTDTISGTIGLASGNSANVMNIQFYTDSTYIYFKFPELFKESFRISMSDLGITNYSSIQSAIGGVSSIIGGLDASSISRYSDLINSCVNDLLAGYNKMIEECIYKKTGSNTYQSENGDFKVSVYDVTLTDKALAAGINAAIDALYSDTNVSSYMSLLTSFTGYTKDTIKAGITNGITGMNPVKFTIYVNGDNKIIKAMMDLSAISSTSAGNISIECIGRDRATDYIIMQVDIEGTAVKYTMQNSGFKQTIALDVIPNQTLNNGEFLSVGMDVDTSGATVSIGNLYCKGNVGNDTFDLSMSGNSETSTFSSMALTSSSFKGAINPNTLSTTQENALAEELSANLSVIKKLVSDSLYNQLFISVTNSNSL